MHEEERRREMKLRQKFLLVACVVLFVLPLVQACIVVDTGVFSPAQSLEWIGLVFLSVLPLVALEREKISETIRDLVEVSALSAMFAGLEIVVCCQPSGMGREACYFFLFPMVGILAFGFGMKFRRTGVAFAGKVLLACFILYAPSMCIGREIMVSLGFSGRIAGYVPYSIAVFLCLCRISFGIAERRRMAFNEGIVPLVYLVVVRSAVGMQLPVPSIVWFGFAIVLLVGANRCFSVKIAKME